MAFDMFLTQGNSVCWDPDLEMLAEFLAVVDGQLEIILRGLTNAAEAYEGYFDFDSAEHITGLGFVACQTYLTATYGFLNLKKLDALSAGPHHSSGQTIVQIINHAANFWKHHDEWHLDKSKAQQERVRYAFATIGFPVDLDYPLGGILADLAAPEPAAFKPLVARLEQWREELRGAVT